jgi:hypothetical protein
MMEDKLKKLSIHLDKEISREKVFTDKDKYQILSQIKQSPIKRQTNRPFSLIPKLLTAALFSGIIFSSYLYFDKELMSSPNVKNEQEIPVSPVYIQQVSGSGSAAYSSKKQLTITFTIKNESKETIKEPLKYRITFLNKKLISAAGTKSKIIEPEEFRPVESGQSETLSKAFVLKEEVAKEDLKGALQVETISGTDTLNSFVIHDVNYEMNEEKNPENHPVVKDKEEEEEEEKEEGSEQKEEAPVPPKAEKATTVEAKQIVLDNLDDIRRTFAESGEKHNWNVKNPATYETAGPDFEPYVTANFSENILRELLPVFYCQCDIGFLPIIHPSVRFQIASIDEDTIEVSGLEPTNEVNVGDQWRFKLVKEDETWKMDQWKRSSLEGANLNLTKEEAGQLLMTETQSATFIKEIQLKNNHKVYVFMVKGADFEHEVAISSRDTSYLYDYEDQIQ